MRVWSLEAVSQPATGGTELQLCAPPAREHRPEGLCHQQWAAARQVMKPLLVSVATAALALAVVVAQPPSLSACTTFCARTGDAVLFGRNYDFEIGDGVLLVNPRGLHKRGFLPGGPQWMAAYGSVTFNQFGREFPMGGMNERGLVVELLWLDLTEYSAADHRPNLGVLEWIQYQLDTAATVAEVVASDREVRVGAGPPLHYLVSDASGAAGTIEYLAGRLVAHAGVGLPVAVLANSTYEDSLAYWRRRGETSLPGGSSSEARFARAASQIGALKHLVGQPAIDRAFAILANVAQRSTQWTVVYDQTARVVQFRTKGGAAVRKLSMNGLDWSCRGPARVLPLDERVAGDVSGRLQPYSADANEALVRQNYRLNSVTRRTPLDEVLAIAAHPARAVCKSP